MAPRIGGLWYTYSLSSDGCRFVLQTEKGEAIFDGIEVISMYPTPLSMQRTGEFNYLDYFIEYQIEDYLVFNEENHSLRAVIEYGSLRVTVGFHDRNGIKEYRAFSFCDSDIFILLVCRKFEFRPRHPDGPNE